MVVVSTLFGILAKAVYSNSTEDDKVLFSVAYAAIKDLVNGLGIDQLAKRSCFPTTIHETPPSSPEEPGSNQQLQSQTIQTSGQRNTCETIGELDH